jgi:acyl carrier protein
MTTPTERLLNIVERELGVDIQTLTPDSSLADLADSLDWVNLIGALEDEFRLTISFEEGLRLQTLQDLMALLSEQEPQLVSA